MDRTARLALPELADLAHEGLSLIEWQTDRNGTDDDGGRARLPRGPREPFLHDDPRKLGCRGIVAEALLADPAEARFQRRLLVVSRLTLLDDAC